MKHYNHIQIEGCLACFVLMVFPLLVAYILGYLTANLTH